MAARGDDPVSGARPLKRLIQKEVLDGLARMVLGGQLTFRANLAQAPPAA